MSYEYLLRNGGKIINTVTSLEELDIVEGRGMVHKDDYFVAEDVTFYFDFDLGKKIYIVDVKYVPFEEVPDSVRKKMMWDRA
jgi:hypothetical protein